MARFLNTSGTTFYLEEMIKSARNHIILISPYLRINTRLRQLLADADAMDIEIEVVYGKSELREDEELWLNSLEHLCVRFCENLHAKCYLNESSAIVTSLNLYEFSQVNNNEMGIFIDRTTDQECFADTEKEALRILRISEIVKPRVECKPAPVVFEACEPPPSPNVPKPPAEDVYEKLTTARLAEICGVKTAKLMEYFTAKAYLEIRDGKPYLTERGKEKGAEARFGKGGVYFLWPKVLLRKFQS